jgi:hypothetical protein
MSARDVKATLFSLIRTGLEAVGCRLPVEFDGEAIYLRTLVVVFTDLGRIQCYDLADPDTPIMDFPMDAVQSAASAVVVHLLTGMVTRAIEADERARM